MVFNNPVKQPMQIPRHVAIIMDGNGRWARRRFHPRVFGHVRGAKRAREIVRAANHLGIKALTLYAFSTENWSRPLIELGTLWKLFKKSLYADIDEFKRENVRFRVIGETERLDPDLKAIIDETTRALEGNTGMLLTFAISYGSRAELVRAARLFAEDCAAGVRKPADLDEELLEQYLWTRDLGDLSEVDLVIRTGSEKRVSNFLLWQAAYAEFVFSDLYWPDFEPKHLREALQDYSSRERRFGKVGKDPTPLLETSLA